MSLFPDIRLPAREGQTHRTGTGSSGPIGLGRVTSAGRPHAGVSEMGETSQQASESSPPAGCRDLPTPAASRPRPPQALTSLWSPELAPVESQRMRLRTHSPRSRRAPSGHHGSEPVRRGGGVMGGIIVEGRDRESEATTFREAGYKFWNSRSLVAGVRSGAGGKPLAPLSRDRGQSSSGCLAHGFL